MIMIEERKSVLTKVGSLCEDKRCRDNHIVEGEIMAVSIREISG